MMWISIALIVIVTEAILYDLYKERYRKQETENEDVVDYEERLKALEDQVSNIRVAQGMRRRDGQYYFDYINLCDTMYYWNAYC